MYLVDTAFLSESSRLRPHPTAVAWIESELFVRSYISVITMGEFRRGLLRMPVSRRRERLTRWTDATVASFQERVLPIDLTIMERWAAVAAEAEARGVTLPRFDSLIAATALVHGLTVVTPNVRDFERCGVPVLNPMSG